MQPQFAVESLFQQGICISSVLKCLARRFHRFIVVDEIDQAVCFFVCIRLIVSKLLGFFLGLHNVGVSRDLLTRFSIYQGRIIAPFPERVSNELDFPQFGLFWEVDDSLEGCWSRQCSVEEVIDREWRGKFADVSLDVGEIDGADRNMTSYGVKPSFRIQASG